MATDTSFFARTNLPDCNGKPVCSPPPMCPVCGGLECLCRPRFFAGQLLTEEDLNRLDRYIVGKNRLHNRYLVGWGVACGLEVVCNVCGADSSTGGVLVKPGYALSPCGNDIVVCKPEAVDVCALINYCRPPQDDCRDLFASRDPVTGQPVNEDNQSTEDWVLAVCYNEKPARGMTALIRSSPTSSACKCGGSCGCGGQCGCGGEGGGSGSSCSCGGNSTSTYKSSGTDCGCGKTRPAPNPNNPSALPDQCEPTMVCEGYRFVAYKVKPKPNEQRPAYGAAAKRFICCILPLFQDMAGVPTQNVAGNPQQAVNWVYALRDAVREFILGEGFYDCDIAAKLSTVAIPTVANANTANLNAAAYAVLSVALLVIQKCLCAALLPPCPEPSQLDCVPIATITVTRGKCRVVRVCNIGARKFLTTLPNITYWLSFFTGGKEFLRPFLEALCCTPLVGRFKGAQIDQFNLFREGAPPQPRRAAAGVAGGAQPDPGPLGPEIEQGPALSKLLLEALMRGDQDTAVESLLLGALDVRDANGKPFATTEELEHPAEFVMLNQVVAPFLRQFVPRDGLAAVAGLAGSVRSDTSRTDELAQELAELKRKVQQQERTIREMRRPNG